MDAKLLTVYRFFFLNSFASGNLNLGGRKRSKFYQSVEKEGEIWREKRERKEAKEEVYSI